MDIEDDDYSLGFFVVSAGYSSESLLSCGVPDLQFDQGLVD